MYLIREHDIYCPYCNERFTIVVDCSVRSQRYVEDCYVCCRPIVIQTTVEGEDELYVTVSQENG